jgi:hypothetical protein
VNSRRPIATRSGVARMIKRAGVLDVALVLALAYECSRIEFLDFPLKNP